MSAVLDELKDWGCDVRGAMGRMLDDEEFYLSCLEQTATDPTFAQLTQALVRGDIPAAFDVAHTLKGVLANLGLTPMLETVVEIVEALRAGTGAGTEHPMEVLNDQREKLKRALKGTK